MNNLKNYLAEKESEGIVDANFVDTLEQRILNHAAPVRRSWLQPARYVALASVGVALLVVFILPNNEQNSIPLVSKNVLAASIERTFGRTYADLLTTKSDEFLHHRYTITHSSQRNDTATYDLWIKGDVFRLDIMDYFPMSGDLHTLVTNGIVYHAAKDALTPDNTYHVSEANIEETREQRMLNVGDRFRTATHDLAVSVTDGTEPKRNIPGYLIAWETNAPVSDARIEYLEGPHAGGDVGFDSFSYREFGSVTVSPEVQFTNVLQDGMYQHQIFFSESISIAMYGLTFQVVNDSDYSPVLYFDATTHTVTPVNDVRAHLRSFNDRETPTFPISTEALQPLYYLLYHEDLLTAPQLKETVVEDGATLTHYGFQMASDFDFFSNQWKKRELLGGTPRYVEFWVDESAERITRYRVSNPEEDFMDWDVRIAIPEIVTDIDATTFFSVEGWKHDLGITP